jgi:hypothetical protein
MAQMARKHAGFITLLSIGLLLPAFAVFPEGVFVPAPEAPTTIFSTRLGSADVDLSLLGSWTLGGSVGWGFILAPGPRLQALDAFPGLVVSPLISQTPDITLSLELMKRFFVDVSLIGSFDNNAMRMGYRGAPGEVVQSVIIGTQDVGMAPSALLQVPSQPRGSLGISAELAAGTSTNDLLLRWDPTTQKHKTFIGKNELTEQEVGIDSYVRGIYFFLPDTGLDPGTLQAFIEDPSGTYPSADGRKYRAATFDDVVLDSTLGLASLKNTAKGRVLVFYKKGGNPVGATVGATLPKENPTPPPSRILSTSQPFSSGLATYLGLDMTHRWITLPGIGDCLLLWEPGDSSPFEIDNSYAFASTPPSDVSRISFTYRLKDASASAPTNVLYQSIPAEKRFVALQDRNVRATFANFYPFPDPTGLLYGPQRDALSGHLDFDLLVQFLTPVSDFTLEASIEPGSVQVSVNGIAENRFEVDPSSGKLTLLAAVLPTDRIEVSYRKVEPGTTGGDILFAWKDRIPLADWATLTLSAGLRWNANPWTFSQEPYSKSGTVIAAIGVDGKTDALSYTAEAGAAFTNPDTTGVLRLFGMEGSSTAIDLSEELAYPASAPADWTTPGLPTPAPTQSNRGELFYRNYRLYGALGTSSLQPLDGTGAPVPAPDQKPYGNGSRMGPYNVLGSSTSTRSKNLVLEYALTAVHPWVGAQIPISAGSDVDLSESRALSIRLRGLPLTGTATILLQLGSISEDLDGLAAPTGQPKSEGSSADSGFSFVDQANSVTLKVGAAYDSSGNLVGNGVLDSEDRNTNGILDLEDKSRIVTLPHPLTADPAIAPGTGWTVYTFQLTDADRQKLIAARGVRIIIMAAGGATGSIVIDSISIEGTPFSLLPATPAADRDHISVRQIPEYLSASDPGPAGRLEAALPGTYKLFHPNGEQNEVLETEWGVGVNVTTPFSVRGFVPLGTGGIQYQTFVSDFRTPTTGVEYAFSLADATGTRIRWRYTPITAGWHEVKVTSLNGGQILVDGTPAGTLDQFDKGYGSLSFLQVDAPASAAAPAGSFYLDEVYCTDPAASVGAALVGTFSAQVPGTILGFGKVALLGNLSVRQDLSLATAGFSSLYGVPHQTSDISSRSHAEADVAGTRTAIDLLVRDEDGSAIVSGGHRVTFPSFTFPVSVTDAFSLTATGDFSREDSLLLTGGSIISLSFDAIANAAADAPGLGLLTQGWQAGLNLNPFPPLTTATQLALSQSVAEYPLAAGGYGARWVREAALLLPWQGPSPDADVQRAEKLGFTAGMAGSPVGFSFAASAGAVGTNYSSAGFSQQTDVSMAASLLVTLGQAGSSDSLSIGYKRGLSLVTAPPPVPVAGPRFQAETEELARIIGLQSYLVQGLPVAEIFRDNEPVVLPAWETASQATYVPSLNITLQRSYGSHLADLFLPSSIELDIGQELSKAHDSWKTVAYVRPRTTTRAVNLFGALGAFPFLAAARTDEYSLSMSGSVEGAPGTTPVLATLTLEGYATFTGDNDSELTFLETLRRDQATIPPIVLTFTNDAQALLDWKLLPPQGVPLPFFPADVTAAGHFENRESLDFTVSYQAPGAFHPFTVLLGHSTSLVYPGHGSIKASANAGVDIENPNVEGQGLVWRFAVRAALEAKLTL